MEIKYTVDELKNLEQEHAVLVELKENKSNLLQHLSEIDSDEVDDVEEEIEEITSRIEEIEAILNLDHQQIVSKKNFDSQTKKFDLTREGLEQFQLERKKVLEDIEINKIELQEARAQGDLSENAEYDAARENQARLNHRLQELDDIIKNHVIIERVSSTGVIVLTSKVVLEDLSETDPEERIKTYQLVGEVEADPLNGKISKASPLGMAIFGKKVGNVVEVDKIAEPYLVKILKVD